MNIYQLSNKFAMKLGLQSRPSVGHVSDMNELIFDIREPAFDMHEPNEESHEALKYLGGGEDSEIGETVRELKLSMHELFTQLDLSDWDECIFIIDNMNNDLKSIKKLIEEKQFNTNKDINKADVYMYDPIEPEPNEDFEHHMESYLSDLDVMDWNELWSERKRLERDRDECLMDDVDVPYVLEFKLKEINKRLK